MDTTQEIQDAIVELVSQLDGIGTKLTELAASLSAPEDPAEETPSAPAA